MCKKVSSKLVDIFIHWTIANWSNNGTLFSLEILPNNYYGIWIYTINIKISHIEFWAVSPGLLGNSLQAKAIKINVFLIKEMIWDDFWEKLLYNLGNKALESWILRQFLGWRYCFYGHFWEIGKCNKGKRNSYQFFRHLWFINTIAKPLERIACLNSVKI